MTHRSFLLVTCVVVFFHPALASPRVERLIELNDFYRLESAAEPAISPDGSLVAFTRRFLVEESNERRSEIWLARTDGSTPARRLTSETFSADSPRFSPDGKLLVFRSRRPARQSPGTTNNIWFLALEGPGEAYRVPGVDSMPEFSPDGRWIALTKRTPPKTPKPGRSDFEKTLDDRFKGRIFDWMQYRFDRRGYLPDPRDPVTTPPKELYVLPAGGGEARRLTSLGVDVSAIAWSPDSLRIAFVADTEQRNELVYRHADLWIADLEGSVERLTTDGFDYGAPAFSPDGKRLAYRGGKGLSQVIAEKSVQGAPIDLFIRDLDSGEVEILTADWHFRPGGPVWSPDGESLYFEAGVGGNRHLFRAAAGSVEQVTQGERQLSGFVFDGASDRMAFVGQDAAHPPEVFVSNASGGDQRPLSLLNAELLAELSLSAPLRLTYPSADGTEVEGWLMLPSGSSEASERHPLILSIHGGPHGAYGQRFSLQFQLWAARGYAVLYTNPRGSSGYGHDFLYATWGGGWGNLDTEDVLAGVDHVLRRHPLDENRMGVTGYSYGGFLTNWVITRTKRFSAAISGAGISNWISDYGTADIPRTKESEFYGPPWKAESAALLRRQSPIFYAHQVSTPTLFVHGESDFRVPIEQAEQMYTALHKLGVPARFIRYPDSYHGGWTPWNMVHRYHSELKWWEKHLSVSETLSD